ncbi:hypothetical protein [Streptomyces sp. NPDC048521]|uniref:hypothetical protein n=1 Tax=Streptomyces sp. NPDC048521 TaxID=3365566 RepID=UPI00371220B0
MALARRRHHLPAGILLGPPGASYLLAEPHVLDEAASAGHVPQVVPTDSGGEPEKVLTHDEMLDAISLYRLTNTWASSSWLYWEGYQAGGGPFDAFHIPDLPIHWNEFGRGGHFAAWG